jgi:hypothetical protein
MLRIPARLSRQRGLTLFGFLFTAVVLILLAMLAMKAVPAYIEFFSIKKILNSMGQESDLKSKSNAELRSDFLRRASVDYVDGKRAEDLLIERKAGVPTLSVDYEFRTPLAGNVSLVIEFKASSDPNATAAADVE